MLAGGQLEAWHSWWNCWRAKKAAGAAWVGNQLWKSYVVMLLSLPAVDHICPAPNLQSTKLPNKPGPKELAAKQWVKSKDFCASHDLLRGVQAAVPCYFNPVLWRSCGKIHRAHCSPPCTHLRPTSHRHSSSGVLGCTCTLLSPQPCDRHSN